MFGGFSGYTGACGYVGCGVDNDDYLGCGIVDDDLGFGIVVVVVVGCVVVNDMGCVGCVVVDDMGCGVDDDDVRCGVDDDDVGCGVVDDVVAVA